MDGRDDHTNEVFGSENKWRVQAKWLMEIKGKNYREAQRALHGQIIYK